MSDDKMIEVPEGRFAPWLMEPMRRNRAIYWKVALAAVVINIFALVTSLFTMVVYDRVVPNNATASLVALVDRPCHRHHLRLRAEDAARLFRRRRRRPHRPRGRRYGVRQVLSIRLDQKRGSTGALAGVVRELETLRDFFASATLTADRRRAVPHHHPGRHRDHRRPGRVRAAVPDSRS